LGNIPGVPEDTRLALRHADQARTDFAIIEDELEVIHAPARVVADAARAVVRALMGMPSGSAFTILDGVSVALMDARSGATLAG
jgi:hypothetical protein